MSDLSSMELIATAHQAATSDAWDDFVTEQPDGTFCHLHGWSRVFQDSLGHDCTFLTAVSEAGETRGVLPLVRVRSALFGHHLVSMPFLNYGGPIGSPEAVRLLCDEAAALASSSGVDLLELRSRSEVAAPSLTTNRRKITVLVDLPSDPDVFWKEGLKAKVRSQVRRPRKEGMEARFGAMEMEPFYRVFARGMRDLGTPVLAKRFFEQLVEVFPDRVEFGAVYLGTEPVAAGCGFTWKGEFEMTWAASVREYNRMAPNMLLYWSFMERMIHRGLTVFNFGRCTPGGGTHRFKRQWGDTRDVPLPWAQWSKSGVTSTPNPDGRPVLQLATKAWSRLPLAIANRVGPSFARILP